MAERRHGLTGVHCRRCSMVQIRARTSNRDDGTYEAWSVMVGAVSTASWRRWFLVAWSRYGHWRLSLTFKLLCFWSSGWWACAGHLLFFFFFFCVLWVMGSMIRCGHRWWSSAWEASLASLLAWRWKTHVGLGGIYRLQGLVWACSRSHGAKTWKVLSYLASLLFWWFLLSSGCLRLCCMD